jgi:hypothetical protein
MKSKKLKSREETLTQKKSQLNYKINKEKKKEEEWNSVSMKTMKWLRNIVKAQVMILIF